MADTDELEPEEDQSSICWRDNDYLSALPGGVLQHHNIVDYFSHSPFYDRNCTNSRLHTNSTAPEKIDEMMAVFKGKQYLVLHAQIPRLYDLVRQVRQNPSSVIPTGLFYVIDGTIYESPTLQAVIQTRLMSSVFHIHSAFKIFSTFTEFDPIHYYSWDRKKSAPEAKEESDDMEKLKWAGRADQQHMGHIINEWRKTIAPRKRPLPPPSPAVAALQPAAKKARTT